MEKQWALNSGHTHMHTHTYLSSGYSEMSRNTSRCQSLTQNGSIQYKTGALSPAGCATMGYSIQSTAVPLRLANSHHKLELQDSSTHPTAATPPGAVSPHPKPSLHLGQQLKGHAIHLEKTKTLARTQRGIIAEEMLSLLLCPKALICFSAVEWTTQSSAASRGEGGRKRQRDLL